VSRITVASARWVCQEGYVFDSDYC
jgi:hypothetical protein